MITRSKEPPTPPATPPTKAALSVESGDKGNVFQLFWMVLLSGVTELCRGGTTWCTYVTMRECAD